MTDGNGRMIHATGDYYVGQWKRNKVSGKGKYVQKSGASYEGDWFNDKQHG